MTQARTDISDQEIANALSRFGISPNSEQTSKIRAYLAFLMKWNEAISLTSITDPVEIVERHFGESMYAAKLLPVENCRLVDVGTGPGFPGLALKIACPGLQLTLIEANNKKCAFLHEVVRTLDLAEVTILQERFERIHGDTILADVISSRAVGSFKELLRWSKNALSRSGRVMIWVGAEDTTRISRVPGWTWEPAIRLPESRRRFIQIGRPNDLKPTSIQ